MLEDRHVAADLAESAEGDDAERRPAGSGGGVVSSGWGWLTVSPDWSDDASRTQRDLVGGGLDQRQAHRRPTARTPSSRSAALAMIAPWVRFMTRDHRGISWRCSAMARGEVARRRPRRPSRRTGGPATCADDADDAGGADGSGRAG